MAEARYDGLAEWYEQFRPALPEHELNALRRLLGPGDGRCLDLGCGTGVPTEAVTELGWSVVGVDISADLLGIARGRGLEVVEAPGDALPFEDASFDAGVSFWTHTDIDEFSAAVAEVARVLRAGSPFVYMGVHPCFVGPHSRFLEAQGVPQLSVGYRQTGRYDGSAFGVENPDGVRVRVGAVHLTLHDLLAAFTKVGLRIERFEELGERDYPHVVALRARR
jgi:SAM-dependent methyltransferase